MSFQPSITLTVNSVAKVLTFINNDNNGSTYQLLETTGEYVLNIRHTKRGDRKLGTEVHRHNVELVYTLYAASPVPQRTRKIYLVLENDFSDDLAAVGYIDAALIDWFDTAGVLTDLNKWQI